MYKEAYWKIKFDKISGVEQVENFEDDWDYCYYDTQSAIIACIKEQYEGVRCADIDLPTLKQIEKEFGIKRPWKLEP